MSLLIINIKGLVQVEDTPAVKVCGDSMARINTISNAWLYIEEGLIHSYGPMSSVPVLEPSEIIDASGKFVLPSYCDSHTHLVYAGSREIEYIDKIKGLSYEEIARRGGGILNSAKLLAQTSEEELFDQSINRINEIKSLKKTSKTQYLEAVTFSNN